MSNEFTETATTVQEIAVGAAKAAAEVASDPVGSARKQARDFERKGAPTVRRINRQFNARLNARLNALRPEKVTIMGVEVDGKLPEKVAIKGLQMVKLQARRQDVVGDVAKRTLRIFNASFKTIARTATHLEHASELTPHRTAAAKTAKTARPAARTRRPRRRAVRRAA